MESMDVLVGACAKFLLAVALGSAIGLERELKGHAAGLRTHILVCLGSALFMVIGDEIGREFLKSGVTVWLDKGRVIAGIITGVGFLGAGAIINVGSVQRGLTTAAMIWLIAGIGAAVGAGYFLIAITAAGFGLFAAIGLEAIERRLPVYERLLLTVRMPLDDENLSNVENVVRERGFFVAESRMRVDSGENHSDVTFELSRASASDFQELAFDLRKRFPSASRITFEKR
jgi:putative Mg2+ transporter-C (MgtC) family protein